MESEPIVLEKSEKKEKTKGKTVKRRDYSKMTKKEKDLLEIRRKCIQKFRENV